MKAPVDATALRIVMQYFRRDVRVCELECGGASLALHISTPDDAPRGSECCIEAHGRHSGGEIVIKESRTTRHLALLAVGEAWVAKGPGLGLPLFDWVAVASVLKAVRIID
jgi:hypothetical protein